MTLRTQALLCFATAFVAIFLYPSASVQKYVVGVAAALVGASIWQRDKQHRAQIAARQARISALEGDEDEDDEEPPSK